MEPIVVPAPPCSAYNHNRRVSDLLLHQLQHFQHVEMKSGDFGIDPEIARNIHTEGGAANYIAAVTMAIRARGLSGTATEPALSYIPVKKNTKKTPKAAPLSTVAAAARTSARKKSTAKKGVAKKATIKPTKGKKNEGATVTLRRRSFHRPGRDDPRDGLSPGR